MQSTSLDEVDGCEGEVAERALYEAFDVLAHRNNGQRVVERRPGRFALEHNLRLFVELGALFDVGRFLRLADEVVELLVAPLRAVVAADGVATEQGVEEVVRIAVV